VALVEFTQLADIEDSDTRMAEHVGQFVEIG
jgi:hypothetical protein